MKTLKLNLKGSSFTDYEGEAKALLKQMSKDYNKVCLNHLSINQINGLDKVISNIIEDARNKNSHLIEIDSTQIFISDNYKRIIDEKNKKYTLIRY